jgi:hypothetical protein
MIEHQVHSNAFAYLPEYMVNLILGFLIWRRPIIFTDVAMWEHRAFYSEVLDVAKFTNLTQLSLLISCKLSFLIVGLKMSSLSTLALKFINKLSYLGNLSYTRSNSSQKLPFTL